MHIRIVLLSKIAVSLKVGAYPLHVPRWTLCLCLSLSFFLPPLSLPRFCARARECSRVTSRNLAVIYEMTVHKYFVRKLWLRVWSTLIGPLLHLPLSCLFFPLSYALTVTTAAASFDFSESKGDGNRERTGREDERFEHRELADSLRQEPR